MEELVVTQDWRHRLEQLVGPRRESWVLVAVVAVAIIGSYLLWGRSEPDRIAPPARAATLPSLGVTPTDSRLLVHVAGAVRHPGVYEFSPGARVADAIASAGGVRRSADLSILNLAELLVDGSKIEVPARGATDATPPSLPASSPSAPMVNINTGDQVALETVPGIGPVTALAILQHRDAIGGFSSFEQVLDVDGIGPATLEAIRPYVTL